MKEKTGERGNELEYFNFWIIKRALASQRKAIDRQDIGVNF
jgi:hypothetical protein